MSATIFDATLTTPEMASAFDDAAIVRAMLRFEAALALAQADAGVIPADAARAIAGHCRAEHYDLAAIIEEARSAGSVAIPLIKALTHSVAQADAKASGFVHWGSTSQDVIDTTMVLVTRDALTLIERDLDDLIGSLLTLIDAHAATPILARTLLQPAQVTSFGLKVAGWTAPLMRSREHLRSQQKRALALQLGGAVGTLSAMGTQASDVAKIMAANLGLTMPAAPWHTQRDQWVRLGLEVSVLVGSLGKIAIDLALLAQAEVGELAEPSAIGRGGSSTM
ncbi:MAG: lyase family protein, partial [Pseudomonadota bacterium]|nr:lyase family protein [Pseudomonadota bacterium]